MARNQAGTTLILNKEHNRQALVYTLLSLGTAILSTGIERQIILTGHFSVVVMGAITLLHALIALFVERCLRYWGWRDKSWVSRFAVLSSAGLSWFSILAWKIWGEGLGQGVPSYQTFAPISWEPSLDLLLAAALGSLVGGLSATGLREGLWEDNAPPPQWLQKEVERQHRELLGSLPPMPHWKRIFDLLLASIGFIISIPIWVAAIFLVWFEDPGPVLFIKNSVGKGGRNFRQYKFRTMVHGAEAETGPVLAQENDGRVLYAGRFLRKTALDELPQLINILRGEMSFVGPRPQRTILVYEYLHELPAYAERHKVLPGLAGLAQVAGDYYLTPLQKLRLDRIYIKHMSLGLDLKLIFLAFAIAFWFRWRRGWSGRLPRIWMHR